MSCNKELLQTIGKGTRAVIIGGGRSGMAAAKLLHQVGAFVRLLDKNPEKIPQDFQNWAAKNKVHILGGEHTQEQFAGTDIVVPSPGVAFSSFAHLVKSSSNLIKAPEVLAETELAWRMLEGEPIIAITGTSGKTTTTSLCAAMLQAHGLHVFTGGNIGTPLSEYVLSRLQGGPKADTLVLELSSFQLQTCHSLRPKVAMLLNISANHLDYHADMKEYVDAKMRLFRCQQDSDLAVFGESLRGLPTHYRVEARKVYFDPTEQRFPETNLLGAHNHANAEAAWQAVREFGVSLKNAANAVANFQPLPHRLEKVALQDNILFVNDSKCTTVDALRVALEAMERPTWLLAGGKFKGGDLASVLPLLQEKCCGIALYGGHREDFAQAWQAMQPTWHEHLADALAYVRRAALSGQTVLLAPATASYDQYKDYLARGEHFKSLVLGAGK